MASPGITVSSDDLFAVMQKILERLRAIESLLREQNEQAREREARRRRKAAALSIVAGNGEVSD